MQTIHLNISTGDSREFVVNLEKGGVPFSPDATTGALICTVKRKYSDADKDSVFQKATGAGIVLIGSTAKISLLRADTVNLEPQVMFIEFLWQDTVTMFSQPVAAGLLTIDQRLTRKQVTSVSVVTTETPLPFGGGSGSSTYAALTDKATVDLPAVNNPLATALAGKASLASLGTLATQDGTFSGTSSGNNTGDQPTKLVDVADNTDRFALTSADVNVGDIVRVGYEAGVAEVTRIDTILYAPTASEYLLLFENGNSDGVVFWLLDDTGYNPPSGYPIPDSARMVAVAPSDMSGTSVSEALRSAIDSDISFSASIDIDDGSLLITASETGPQYDAISGIVNSAAYVITQGTDRVPGRKYEVINTANLNSEDGYAEFSAPVINIPGNAATVASIGNLTGVVTSLNRETSIADDALSIAKTSGLQTALAGKASLASPTFTGTVMAGGFAGPLTGNVTGNADTANAASASTSFRDFFNNTNLALEIIVAGGFAGPLTGNVTGNADTANAALGIKTATTTVGVSAAAAPSAGQVLTASSGTLATWQTPSAAAAGTLTGATLASNVTGSSLTSTGTLTGGATGVGFTVALNTATITGTIPAANTAALTGDVTKSAGSNVTTLTNIGNLTGVVTSTNRVTTIADSALTIAKTSGLQPALDAKQATLVSGTNIRTVNGNSLLGTTDLVVSSNLTSGPVTSSAGVSAIANAAITNAMLANGAVANLSGTNTGDQTNISGSAATLTTSRNINGVPFNGSADITVTAAAATLTGTTLPALSGAALTALNADNLTTGRVGIARLVNTQTVGDANATIAELTRDVILTTALTAARTYTLPLANTYPAGARVSFSDIVGTLTSTNTATLLRAGTTDTINGATSIILSTANASVMLISDGSGKWNVDIRGVSRGGTGSTNGSITGTGALTFATTGATALTLATNGVSRWNVSSAGNLLSVVDNTYDIGASAANRPRSIYAATHVIADGRIDTATGFFFIGGGSLRSSSDGVFRLWNNVGTDFGRLQLGGTTSAFPSIKRNGTAINIRLADDSADAPLTASNLTASGTLSVTGTSTFAGVIIAGAQLRLKGYTVSTLPTGTIGDTAYVTDALAPTFMAIIVGGGSVVTRAFYNGTNWTAQ